MRRVTRRRKHCERVKQQSTLCRQCVCQLACQREESEQQLPVPEEGMQLLTICFKSPVNDSGLFVHYIVDFHSSQLHYSLPDMADHCQLFERICKQSTVSLFVWQAYSDQQASVVYSCRWNPFWVFSEFIDIAFLYLASWKWSTVLIWISPKSFNSSAILNLIYCSLDKCFYFSCGVWFSTSR